MTMFRSARAAMVIAAGFTILGLGARAASAQQAGDEPRLQCDHEWGNWGDDSDSHYCEMRDTTIAATGSIDLDASPNGGIAVHAWNRQEVRLVTRVQARGGSDAEAKALAKEVAISVHGGTIETKGPRREREDRWSVSYELWVPAKTDLDLNAVNGGIAVRNVEGHMSLRTVNGGIVLYDVAGDVRGETTNGGVNARLDGDTWRGAGLDLVTTNGGIRLTLPDAYSARLEAQTMNGSLNVDFPVTLQGRITKRISTTLGSGGALLRVRTTNGGVAVRRG